MKREEAVTVLKELLDSCKGLDSHYFELSPPYGTAPTSGGYQLVIKGALDKKTSYRCITSRNSFDVLI